MQSLIYDIDHVNHMPRLTASLSFGHVLITPVFDGHTFTHYETKVKRGLSTTTLEKTNNTTEAKNAVKLHLSI